MFAWEKKNENTYEFKLSHFSVELIDNGKDAYDVYVRTPKINSNLPRLDQLKNCSLEKAQSDALILAEDLLTEMKDLTDLACYEMDVATKDEPLAPTRDDGKKIIWTNEDVATEDKILQFMRDHLGDERVYTEESAAMSLCDENSDWRDDEISNLNTGEHFTAVILEEIHLWNGIRYNAHIVKDVTPSVILETGREYDETTIFAKNGDVWMHTSHHDGTNMLLFRKAPADTDMDELREAIKEYVSEPKPGDMAAFMNVMSITESIYPDVAKIYGWD